MSSYDIILSEDTVRMVLQYKTDLQTNTKEAGNYLKSQLSSLPNKELSLGEETSGRFLQMLMSTKEYRCNSDTSVRGDGSDWNETEFKILGEISIAMKVQVFDNGVWKINDNAFKVHDPPMTAHLLYTQGPLLIGKRFEGTTPDFEAISKDGKINQENYNDLMKKRLLPIFIYAEETAKKENKKALIVIPGLGCGVYAKEYKGQMGEYLQNALRSVIKDLPPCEHIACVRYDPYNECEDCEEIINSVTFRLRKYTGSQGRPQLSRVEDFEETKGEFENCVLYKVVACDHVSFPGNNYFLGVRKSDDGVTAAATNTMEVLTGKKGRYSQGHYLAPEGNRKWLTVAFHNETKLVVDGNIKVVTESGKLMDLRLLSKYIY
ncbi:uncharacterized protein LOC128986181 [Macrosteles quadrilineatus]|uniref:uncharacterized protein LOC128986181 n=1 Tax=Macrosteles quadrilineatus TaxID=74068 RepID=UPI0023E2EB7D|nr:uncharacterized protein LOC128986181 [Macrosteles quadrilineatus]